MGLTVLQNITTLHSAHALKLHPDADPSSNLSHFSPARSSCQDHLPLTQGVRGQLLSSAALPVPSLHSTCHLSTLPCLPFHQTRVQPTRGNPHLPLHRSPVAGSAGLELLSISPSLRVAIEVTYMLWEFPFPGIITRISALQTLIKTPQW